MAAAIHELKLPAVLATAEDHKRFIATHHPGCYVIYHYGQADMRHLFKALRLDDDETTAATCGNTRYVNLKAVEMDSLQIDNGSGLSYIYYRNGKACYLYTTAAHALK
ncbi:hypothetical protein GGI11_001226 [Coemansia sp. RSA 2049]|nr:hypothetical protein H4217_000151 [Coemansia sp. RSA 1939]KAJ2523848.1 hypothetical protein GGI11_001226 [Coemansia sp. RSA 2049]KAJ2617950.1 hypothetical protein EV177_000260 [Coemansia sp. RSA 1804]KAJ2694988.1 hypothetical protein GGH99_000378 [Coemansia sp. RSA 1285]